MRRTAARNERLPTVTVGSRGLGLAECVRQPRTACFVQRTTLYLPSSRFGIFGHEDDEHGIVFVHEHEDRLGGWAEAGHEMIELVFPTVRCAKEEEEEEETDRAELAHRNLPTEAADGSSRLTTDVGPVLRIGASRSAHKQHTPVQTA